MKPTVSPLGAGAAALGAAEPAAAAGSEGVLLLQPVERRSAKNERMKRAREMGASRGENRMHSDVTGCAFRLHVRLASVAKCSGG